MMTFRRSAFLSLILFFVLGGLFMGGGRAQSVVRAEGSTVIGMGTPDSCQSSTAVNALSDAFAAGGIIDFDCGPEPVTINVNTNITDQNVTINGGGLVYLSGEYLRQIFYVQNGGSVLINDLDILYGSGSQGGAIFIESGAVVAINHSLLFANGSTNDGGAIYNMGNLTLNDVAFQAGLALDRGGALYNVGNATIIESDIANNKAAYGGGIYNLGQLTLDRSSIRFNQANGAGGGIFSDGSTQITNSTISHNTSLKGGGLYLLNDTTILNSTIYKNNGDIGAGIWKDASSNTSLKNSIVAESYNFLGTNLSLNCDGPSLTSQGRNIISDGTCLPNPGASGDLFNTDPDLADWQLWTVWGFIPNPNSPAIDYGLGCPSVDQRNFPRPLGGGCDVGSMEFGGLIFMPAVVR